MSRPYLETVVSIVRKYNLGSQFQARSSLAKWDSSKRRAGEIRRDDQATALLDVAGLREGLITAVTTLDITGMSPEEYRAVLDYMGVETSQRLASTFMLHTKQTLVTELLRFGTGKKGSMSFRRSGCRRRRKPSASIEGA